MTGRHIPHMLDLAESHALLSSYGIQMPRQRSAETPEDVRGAAAELGGAVVVKAVAPGLLHKSDAGGVVTDLGSPDRARVAAQAMAERVTNLTGYLVQEQVPSSCELLVGVRRDPVLGAFLVVGLGGLWVELFDDVIVRPAPVSLTTCLQMLAELRGAQLLDGYRGAPPVDREAAARLMEAVSRLAVEHPEIEQLDINPVLATANAAVAVDCLVLLRAERGDPAAAPSEPGPGLRCLLEPRTIAVVGASSDPRKQGGRLFRHLVDHGYQGALYPVNAGSRKVMGRQAFASVAELPEKPDLACVVVPAGRTPGVVRECADAGIPAVIVYASGFAEVGQDGAALQGELRSIADETGIAICGPNTAGVANTREAMCAAISMVFGHGPMRRGGIALVSQSGALGSALLSRIWEQHAGLSQWISCGNEAVVSIGQYLCHVVEDSDTNVVVVFLETIREPASFVRACRRAAELDKPILVYKAGTSELGRKVTASHTAALAGDDALYEALFRSLGVVRIGSLEALVDAAVALESQPRPGGRRIGVVSASGGVCSVVADECARLGLELPDFTPGTSRRIAELIPSFGTSHNPVDVTMGVTTSPEMICDVTAAVMADRHVDAVLVALTTNAGPGAVAISRRMAALVAESVKPLVVARLSADYLAPDAVADYRAARIPLFPTPERALRALRAMAATPPSHTQRQEMTRGLHA